MEKNRKLTIRKYISYNSVSRYWVDVKIWRKQWKSEICEFSYRVPCRVPYLNNTDSFLLIFFLLENKDMPTQHNGYGLNTLRCALPHFNVLYLRK